MSEWINDFKKLGKFLLYFLASVFTIFIINQFITLYNFLRYLHPLLAVIVTIIGLGILIYYGVRLYQQLANNQAIIDIDQDSTAEEVEEYYRQMRLHLEKYIQTDAETESLSDEEAVAIYLQELDQLTTPMILENANAIFLSTAISQNGVLDSFVVLFSMIRMVWQLANVYHTRPSLISLLKLYVEVASVVLMARTIEDADLIEYQIEPLMTSIIGESIASAIPGMVPISNLIVSSLMEGAVNAFLTLRVGIISQDYLKGAHSSSRQGIRRSASMQAVKYMGSILKTNSKIVIESIGRTIKRAGVDSTKKWFK
ncbi:DUF697 domain-containing protein [Ignavigranum ruoffiae]|uniref:Uncharacterized membrane protein YcjF, UPF0283 family n=1 Tax=Ignavigranum ruoffiae TaxID=89093 RepID=A0A1H8YW71_9LACT|nr:DUF697 domain-containing protein [Ignavigranum ruoffiae]UPQ85386.1 YcjF family protein [Ignavigranum ruoffiae]SEP56454.1 Uncharacterized membrane protein YcjF, UPF0283 family [Ignavigranum ruoffiae]